MNPSPQPWQRGARHYVGTCVCRIAIGFMFFIAFGCGGDEGSPALPPDAPPLAEYSQAFEDFRSCVVDGGGEIKVQGTDSQTGRIDYMFRAPAGEEDIRPSSAESTIGRCSNSTGWSTMELRMDQAVFGGPELSEADRQHLAEDVLPCLELNGVGRPMPEEYGSEFAETMELFLDYAVRGLCPGVEAVPG